MGSGGDNIIGYAALIAVKRARILAANPQAYQRITGKAPPPVRLEIKPPRLEIKPVLERGRYISPALTKLIALVARNADISPESIRGGGRTVRLVNARFCIAKLAEEFCPRLSGRAIDDGMLRGEGCCLWARGRHQDRLRIYPDYAALYERCLAELQGCAP